MPHEITVAADGRSFRAVVRTGTPGEAGYYRTAAPCRTCSGRCVSLAGCGGASVVAGPPAGWAAGSPQKKFAYGTGRRPGGGGCLVQALVLFPG